MSRNYRINPEGVKINKLDECIDMTSKALLLNTGFLEKKVQKF